MVQLLHGSARTTAAIRGAIQRSLAGNSGGWLIARAVGWDALRTVGIGDGTGVRLSWQACRCDARASAGAGGHLRRPHGDNPEWARLLSGAGWYHQSDQREDWFNREGPLEDIDDQGHVCFEARFSQGMNDTICQLYVRAPSGRYYNRDFLGPDQGLWWCSEAQRKGMFGFARAGDSVTPRIKK